MIQCSARGHHVFNVSLSRGQLIETETLIKYRLNPTKIIEVISFVLKNNNKTTYETGLSYAGFLKRKISSRDERAYVRLSS